MAIKSLNSVGGFSVTDSVTGNLIVIIDDNGNITTPTLTVTGNTNLGNLGNVTITGGTDGYVLATNGSGSLTWVAQSGGGGNTSITSPMPNLINAGETYYVTANHQGLFGVPIEVNGTLQIDGILVDTNTGIGGNTTQLLYNNGGQIQGISTATYDGSNLNLGSSSNLKITGGTNGYVLQTDGTGNLSWTASSGGGGNGSPDGANTQIQFNNAGSFGASSALTFNNISNVLSTINLSVFGLSNLGPIGNVTITGGSSGQALTTNGSGELSWTTISGGGGTPGGSNTQVQFNNDGSFDATSNLTFDNTTNTLSTSIISATGNITGSQFNGSGAGLSSIPGANVTGTVSSATTAGTVTTAAQPNITSTGTLTSLSVTGNANVGNLGTTAVVATGTGSFGGNVNLNSFNITSLATPVNSTDAATKQYVDDVAQGLHTHDSCNAATTTTLATISGGTVTYNNGTSGVGATLTTTGSYTTIDGVTLSNGMRILVKDEATAANNGIYVRTSSTVLTRADDFDTPAEMAGGDFTFVTAGTQYDNTGWVMTDPVTTVGTSPVVWVQFSGAGTYTAGTGLTLTGTVFSVNAAQSQITSVGTLTSLAVTGNITAGNVSATTFTGAFTGAATTAGTVTTAAQPNITSTGTLTSLGVSGTITAANITANTGIFTGNGSGLTNLAGANVSGAVSYATTANSVAVANVSGIGNISTVNLDGNSSNVLYGNGSFAAPASGGISTGKAIAMAIVFGF